MINSVLKQNKEVNNYMNIENGKQSKRIVKNKSVLEMKETKPLSGLKMMVSLISKTYSY